MLIIHELIIYIAVGALAGFLSGLIGISGGLVIVPSLVFLFQYLHFPTVSIMQYAAGTSLTAAILTSSASLIAHQRRGNIHWQTWRLLVPMVVLGVVCGVALAHLLNSSTLKLLFGFVVLVLACQMLVFGQSRYLQFRQIAILMPMGLVTGALCGMLGIGGGIILVPLLMYYGESTRKAMGTSAGLVLPIAIVGSLLFMSLGHPTVTDTVPYSVGYVYWPAFGGIIIGSMTFPYVGAYVNGLLPKFWLKKIFAAVLLVVAFRLLVY